MGEDLNDAYEKYAPLIRRHAYRVLQDHDAAEDILQEVLLRIWRNQGQWRGTGNYSAWLVGVTVNLSLNTLRSRKRRREDPLEIRAVIDDDEEVFDRVLADSSPGPDLQFERNADRHLIRKLIGELPQEKREVLELIHQQDFGIGEAAERLGIPDGTVKSRLHYGRKTVAARLRSILRDT